MLDCQATHNFEDHSKYSGATTLKWKYRLLVTKKSFAGLAFLVFLFLSMALPSGDVGPINIKLISFFGFIVPLLLCNIMVSIRYLAAALIIAISLGIWFFIGITNLGIIAMPALQLKAIAITIITPAISYLLLNNKIIEPRNIYITIIYAVVFVAVAKVLLLFYALAMHINFINLTENVANFFSTQIMTMEITGLLYRFQLPADLAGPVALFALLSSKLLGFDNYFKKITSLVFVVMITFTCFISYSRYVWGMLFVVILITFPYSRLSRRYSMAALILLIVAIASSYGVREAFVTRLASNATTISDNIRLEELPALLAQFETAPILGHGLGAYLPDLIRDKHSMFSYELQWVALLMQIGIVGIIGVVILLAGVARPFLLVGNKNKLSILILFILWLSSGFFNPYLTSSAAGAIFSFFVAAGYSMRNKPSRLFF